MAITSVISQARHKLPRPLVFGAGTVLLSLGLLVGGWLVWSTVRPAPTGFAPTTSGAGEVPGQPAAVLQYTIDARSRADWAFFDFSTGTGVATTTDSEDWDIAFRRTDVLTNGGDTNPDGAGGAVDLGDVPLAEVEGPPADGYSADAIDDDDGLENPALHGWYNYDWLTHTVSSKGHTYAVRTRTGGVVLLTFVSYYCDDGSAGCVTFQYVYPAQSTHG